jgi:excisionase family DNA binding protein
MTEQPLMLKGEVADYLRVSEKTVERLTRAGRLAPIRLLPGCVRYDPEAVMALVDSSTHPGPPPAAPALRAASRRQSWRSRPAAPATGSVRALLRDASA